MNRSAFLRLLALCLLPMWSSPAAEAPRASANVLFIGNSYTAPVVPVFREFAKAKGKTGRIEAVIVNGAQALDCQAGQFAPMLFAGGLKQRAAGAHRRPSVCVPAPSWFSVYSKPLPNSSTARCRLSVSKPPCNAYGPPLSMPASACPMAVCRR